MCSPSAGGGATILLGVRDSATGWPTSVIVLSLRLHALRDAEMLDLRIGEDLVDRVDRPARHAGLVEALDPVGAAALVR